ncbi:MAG: hypothetical protein D6698_08555 [Gammaproteobacteria bacterium]|nr:MAG: hypothetical protein D6698_08555 [Gammaproteobacteria bacterium]
MNKIITTALIGGALILGGCAGYFKGVPQSSMVKEPILIDPESGEWGEHFVATFDAQAAEMLFWDNFNKNLMISSSKDESLDGLNMNMSFDSETGHMTSVDLSIAAKTALSSPATVEAWKGRVASLEAAFGPEGVKGILSAIQEFVPPEILKEYGLE